MPTFLDREQVRQRRAEAQRLKPVVIVGKDGLTDAQFGAIDAALTTHELVKVKLLKTVEVDKNEAAALAAERTGAQLIQRVGRVIVLYRPNPEEDDADG